MENRRRKGEDMRILLSEGSGLTSRQVATRLGELGHDVEILSSTPVCLTRFTRHVSKVHAVPPFGRAPLAWLDAAERIAVARHADLLFPTQEQVAVLSALAGECRVRTIVPSFKALRRVQDKVSAGRTLAELAIPQPVSIVARTAADLEAVTAFPVFVKQPIGTASRGVRRAETRVELEIAARTLGLGACELLVQQQSTGMLAMVQAVADKGRLVACHANLRLREGAGGGAALKESVALPAVARDVDRLVSALGWHGALSMDVIIAPDGPVVIDINPRLVEPMNAHLSGVDLVGAMLALARNEQPPAQALGKAGVRTRQLLLSVLGAAQNEGTRRAVMRELSRALGRRGEYAGAEEELTPVSGDPIAAVPVVVASLAVLARPDLWRWFHAGGVGAYALTPAAWAEIVSAAAHVDGGADIAQEAGKAVFS
jgi:ATP-grasp domain